MCCKYCRTKLIKHNYTHFVTFCQLNDCFLLGSLSSNESTYAWSVKVLKVLVYKAAQVGGEEFVQMIFNTSAAKVVFSSYKNSATLPEDVARANGHTVLADYLQDVNNR